MSGDEELAEAASKVRIEDVPEDLRPHVDYVAAKEGSHPARLKFKLSGHLIACTDVAGAQKYLAGKKYQGMIKKEQIKNMSPAEARRLVAVKKEAAERERASERAASIKAELPAEVPGGPGPARLIAGAAGEVPGSQLPGVGGAQASNSSDLVARGVKRELADQPAKGQLDFQHGTSPGDLVKLEEHMREHGLSGSVQALTDSKVRLAGSVEDMEIMKKSLGLPSSCGVVALSDERRVKNREFRQRMQAKEEHAEAKLLDAQTGGQLALVAHATEDPLVRSLLGLTAQMQERQLVIVKGGENHKQRTKSRLAVVEDEESEAE